MGVDSSLYRQPEAGEYDTSLSNWYNYASSIFNKLQVADRAEAIARAQKAGLGIGQGELA